RASSGVTLTEHPASAMSVAVQLLAIPGALGATAVLEFCQRGGGTPFPWDPPRRLVDTGPYAYVANPMQLSMTLILIGGGLYFGGPEIALAGVVVAIFSSGFAMWQEQGDLNDRFGQEWRDYRAAVRAWLPRWRPTQIPAATLYYAE